MSFRFWIGSWITLILVILVAIDASAFVCYITRFTEENFATLIAFIFIYKAIENVLSIGKKYPINTHANDPFDYECGVGRRTAAYRLATTMLIGRRSIKKRARITTVR